MGFFKRIKSKIKGDIKYRKQKFAAKHPKIAKVLKKREQTIKKAKDFRKKVLKKTLGGAVLLPLRPFKKLMARRLEKEGVNTSSMKFPKLVEEFHTKIVLKNKKNYDDIPDGWSNDRILDVPLSEFEDSDSVIGAAISGVVTGVLNFIKGLKSKKEKVKAEAAEMGIDVEKLEQKYLTPDEIEMANEAEEIVEKAKKNAKKETPLGQANEKMKSYTKYIIMAIIGVLIVILILRKK